MDGGGTFAEFAHLLHLETAYALLNYLWNPDQASAVLPAVGKIRSDIDRLLTLNPSPVQIEDTRLRFELIHDAAREALKRQDTGRTDHGEPQPGQARMADPTPIEELARQALELLGGS